MDTLPSLTDTSVIDAEEDHLHYSWSAQPSSQPLKPLKPPGEPLDEGIERKDGIANHLS